MDANNGVTSIELANCVNTYLSGTIKPDGCEL